jgi:inosine-uridine nucleoside N-ribohydrolase
MITIQQFRSPSDVAAITAAIKAKTGALVGIAAEQGNFCVTRTTRNGRKFTTETLTGLQSHDDCIAFIRAMAA